MLAVLMEEYTAFFDEKAVNKAPISPLATLLQRLPAKTPGNIFTK